MRWHPRLVASMTSLILLTACRGPAAVTVIPESQLPDDVYSPRPSPSPTQGAEPQRTGTVYMVRKGRLIAFSRELPSAPTRPEALLLALLDGPQPEFGNVTSAIPPDARAISVGVVGNLATVDLSQEFKRGAAGRTLALRVAQIVYTLTEDPNILSVVFAFENIQAPVISASGRILERPVGRKDYAAFAPLEERQGDEGGMS
jgi:sporulation and spore germination protein